MPPPGTPAHSASRGENYRCCVPALPRALRRGWAGARRCSTANRCLFFLAGSEMHAARTFLKRAIPRHSGPPPLCATSISTRFRNPTGARLTAGVRSDPVVPQGKEAKWKGRKNTRPGYGLNADPRTRVETPQRRGRWEVRPPGTRAERARL